MGLCSHIENLYIFQLIIYCWIGTYCLDLVCYNPKTLKVDSRAILRSHPVDVVSLISGSHTVFPMN